MQIRHLPTDAVGWRARAAWVAPMAPHWLHPLVADVLANKAMRSDALLAVADALVEAARAAAAHGQTTAERSLLALAELPRQLAPSRAEEAVG
jgi:hypothetical protein